jgi:hypothetical protein
MLKLLALAGPLYFVILGLARLYFRRRLGFAVPSWVHVIAVLSGTIALLLAWQSQAVEATALWRDLLMILILPALTYLGYGFYGALYVRSNDGSRASSEHDA